MSFKPWLMPMTERHIIVPLCYERELRMEWPIRTLVAHKDVLLGREVIWVETLGL